MAIKNKIYTKCVIVYTKMHILKIVNMSGSPGTLSIIKEKCYIKHLTPEFQLV